jgi:ParB/RepB/Spo0J family partition protein
MKEATQTAAVGLRANPIETEPIVLSLVTVPTDLLDPNDYNPNVMTTAEFAELVTEVRSLGRLPKPIIVRPQGERWLIIDGEHGWRAARETGLASVACEVVDADDFEARRQTYKRNQHGSNDPVKLGRMFRGMMAARALSQRELAMAVQVSEGTVRNALLYGKAADVRNDYAFGRLSVRQVRAYLAWPRVLGDAWLRCGAELTACPPGQPRAESRTRLAQQAAESLDQTESPDGSWYGYLVKAELCDFLPPCSTPEGFRKALSQLEGWYYWEERWCLRGLTWVMLRPYTRHYFTQAWVVREASMMDAALDLILDPASTPPRFVLSPEAFAAVIAGDWHMRSDSAEQFKDRLCAAVRAANGGSLLNTTASVKRHLQEAELQAHAPDYIKASRLPLAHKLAVWKTEPPAMLEIAPRVVEETRRQLARETRLSRKGEETSEQAIIRMMSTAHQRERVKTAYRERSVPELAARVARWMPIYDASTDTAAIATLTTTLSQLTKAELICFAQIAEQWKWQAQRLATS